LVGSNAGAACGLIGALKTRLGPEWVNILVLAAAEFGRTAAPNHTGGTDHARTVPALFPNIASARPIQA